MTGTLRPCRGGFAGPDDVDGDAVGPAVAVAVESGVDPDGLADGVARTSRRVGSPGARRARRPGRGRRPPGGDGRAVASGLQVVKRMRVRHARTVPRSTPVQKRADEGRRTLRRERGPMRRDRAGHVGRLMTAEWRSCDRSGCGHVPEPHRECIGSEPTSSPYDLEFSCTADSSPRALAAASLLLAIPASAAELTPGAPGIGDPYYPAYGNGGYDVSHYDLRLKYQPATDELEGTATLLATATQDLSRFDLDFLLDVQRGPGQRREGGVRDLRRARAGDHPGRRRWPRARRSRVVVRYRGHAVRAEEAYGFTSLAPHPRRRGRGERARGRPGGGSRATTTRSTRPPTTCRSRCPDGTQAITNGTLPVDDVHGSAGRATTGAPTSRRPPIWPRSPSGSSTSRPARPRAACR